MNIQAYTHHYQAAVIKLWAECGLITPQNDPRLDIENKMQVDADLFLIGMLGSEVIGTVMGGYEGHRGWVNYLAVYPSERRNGYAKQLMQRVETLIKQKGCPKINLQVRSTNDQVISFYTALGYAEDKVVSLGKRLV